MSAVRVPSSAREIFETLTGFCDANGVQWESLPQNGSGHCVLAVTFGSQTRKVTFASSPSDNFRGAKNALGYLKRTLRQIGWEPSGTDEDEEDMPNNIRTMKFDAQKPSLGPASEVTMLPVKVKGVTVPVQVQAPSDAEITSYRDSVDLFLVEVLDAGATLKEAVNALQLVGYPLSLDAARERHERASQMLTGGGQAEVRWPDQIRARCDPDHLRAGRRAHGGEGRGDRPAQRPDRRPHRQGEQVRRAERASRMSPDLDRPFIWLALACMAGLCIVAGAFHVP